MSQPARIEEFGHGSAPHVPTGFVEQYEHIAITDFRAHLSRVLNKVRFTSHPVLITEHGKGPELALVPVSMLHEAELYEDMLDGKAIDEAEQYRIRTGEQIVSHEQFIKEIESSPTSTASDLKN